MTARVEFARVCDAMQSRWTSLAIEALRLRSDAPMTAGLHRGSGEDLSGEELLALAGGYVDALTAWGVAPGESVPCLVSTGPVAQALFLAGAVSGRPLAPVGPRLTASEIAVCVENVAGSVLVTERRYLSAATAAAELTGTKVVVADEVSPSGVPERIVAPAVDAVVCILHTSGTTGRAKPVPITDAQLGARATLLEKVCDYRPGDVVVAGSPFHHVAGLGMVTVAMACGSVVVALPRFSTDDWHLVRALEPTHLALIATHVELLVAADAFDLASLRSVFYGASVLRESTLRRLVEEHPQLGLIRWYGQTEASPISWLSPDDHARAAAGEAWLFDTVGRPLPGVEIRIHAPSGDGTGEIWAKAAHLSTVDGEGWRATGDMGSIVEDGYLRLAGRSGDMIIRGGENVYPIEVEKVLAAHPRVADAVVLGVPDELMGQRIKAIVQFADPAAPLTEPELRSYARKRLAGFKVPEVWEFRTGFERNASGKIVRTLLH